MMTRPFVIAALATLLVQTSAHAERRAKKRPAKAVIVAQPGAEDDEEDSDGPEAKGALPTRLGDLIDTAVQLAPDLAKAKVDRSAAQGDGGAARRPQQWVVTAQGSYQREAKGAEVEVEPFSPVDSSTVSGSVGLGRNLGSGGKVSLEAGLVRRDTELSIPAGALTAVNAEREKTGQQPLDEFFTIHDAFAKLTLTQPMLRGFGADIALAQQKQADLVFGESTIRTQLAAEQMIYEIIAAYWDLAFTSFEVDVRADALELAQRQDVITKEQMRAGVAPPTAGGAVTYEIAIRSEALLRAQLELEKKSLELRRKVGLDLRGRQIALRPAEPFEIGDAEWDVDDVLARSRKANRRLATLAIERKRADLQLSVAKNATLPQLDLQLSGGLTGNGATMDAAATGATQAAGFQLMAGIQLQFEIGGAAQAAVGAAQARKQRVEIERIDAARQLDNEVVTAVKQVTSARARVGLADKAIEVGEDNAKAERLKFSAGQTDNFQVMQRQTQLIEARLARGRAVADYHTAVAQLQYLSGMLLEQHGVRVLPRERR